MSESFSYSTEFLLDKSHFLECYEQSVVAPKGLSSYKKAFIFFVVGLLALSVESDYQVAGFFLIGLAVVEACSVYFAKTWWLWRQLLSRVANTQVTLTIDEQGIETKTSQQKHLISWQTVNEIAKTSLGFLVYHQAGKSYISQRVLSESASDYLQKKSQMLTTTD